MSAMSDTSKPNIFPALKYSDGPAALKWLGKAFGFREHVSYLAPDGTIAHAQMTLGNGMIMLGSSGETDPKIHGPPSARASMSASTTSMLTMPVPRLRAQRLCAVSSAPTMALANTPRAIWMDISGALALTSPGAAAKASLSRSGWREHRVRASARQMQSTPGHKVPMRCYVAPSVTASAVLIVATTVVP